MLRAPIDPLYPQLEHGTRLPLPPSLLLSLQPVGVLKLRRKNQSAGLPVPRKMGDGGGKGWLRHAASTAKSIALGLNKMIARSNFKRVRTSHLCCLQRIDCLFARAVRRVVAIPERNEGDHFFQKSLFHFVRFEGFHSPERGDWVSKYSVGFGFGFDRLQLFLYSLLHNMMCTTGFCVQLRTTVRSSLTSFFSDEGFPILALAAVVGFRCQEPHEALEEEEGRCRYRISDINNKLILNLLAIGKCYYRDTWIESNLFARQPTQEESRKNRQPRIAVLPFAFGQVSASPSLHSIAFDVLEG